MNNQRKIVVALNRKNYRLNYIQRVNQKWELGIKTGDQATQILYGDTVAHVLEIIEQLPEGESV